MSAHDTEPAREPIGVFFRRAPVALLWFAPSTIFAVAAAAASAGYFIGKDVVAVKIINDERDSAKAKLDLAIEQRNAVEKSLASAKAESAELLKQVQSLEAYTRNAGAFSAAPHTNELHAKNAPDKGSPKNPTNECRTSENLPCAKEKSDSNDVSIGASTSANVFAPSLSKALADAQQIQDFRARDAAYRTVACRALAAGDKRIAEKAATRITENDPDAHLLIAAARATPTIGRPVPNHSEICR